MIYARESLLKGGVWLVRRKPVAWGPGTAKSNA